MRRTQRHLCRVRPAVADLKRSRAAAQDLSLFYLVQFLPGGTIKALADLTGQHVQTIRQRTLLLATAGFIEFHQEPSRSGARAVVYLA